MGKKIPFQLIYAEEVKQHLRVIEAKYHGLIRSETKTQLLFEPNIESRNRKPLQRPTSFGAQWELRLGPDNRFRIFYQIEAEGHEVRILAVGVKQGNRLLIAGEEVEE